MDFPIIDLASLPDLSTLTGAFGSLLHPGQAGGTDDSLIIAMVYVYEVLAGHGGGAR